MINKDLLVDVQQEIYERLCQNELLTKMYSEAGILRRIKSNIKVIRTNEEKEGSLGWCEYAKPEIVICSPKNEKMLEITGITENSLRYETLIHEAVHAILKNKNGTGLLKINKRKPQKNEPLTFREIGRGINEGYTNWILENSGVPTNTYSVLTSVNKQIEACIGKKKMIRFSRGNYNEIFKALNMERSYGIEFFRQLDDIYNREKLLGEINLISDYVELKIHNLQNEDKITPEEIEEETKESNAVEKLRLYKIVFDEKINKALSKLREEEKNGPKTKTIKIYENRLIMLEKYRKRTMQTLGIVISSIESKILRSLVFGRMDSPTSLIEFEKIMNLMKEIEFSLEQYESELPEFKQLRQKIGQKELGKIYFEIENSIKQKNLTGEILQAEYAKICSLFNNDEWSKIEISTKLANFIGSKSKYPEENKILIKYALDTKTTNIMDRLSIQLTKSGKAIIYQDGGIRAIVKGKETIYIDDYDRTLQKNERLYDKINWTLDKETDYSKLKLELERLKKYKLEQNPHYKIEISNGIIAFIYGKKCEFYDIIEGKEPKIKKAVLLTKRPIKPMVEKTRKTKTKSLVPINEKENFITKIKKFFNRKNNDETKERSPIIIEQNESKAKKFREGLKTNQREKSETIENRNRNKNIRDIDNREK